MYIDFQKITNISGSVEFILLNILLAFTSEKVDNFEHLKTCNAFDSNGTELPESSMFYVDNIFLKI